MIRIMRFLKVMTVSVISSMSVSSPAWRFRFSDKSGLFVNAFYKLANEPENMVTDDSDQMEGEFSMIGMKMTFAF